MTHLNFILCTPEATPEYVAQMMAGIGNYTVHVSEDGAPYEIWLVNAVDSTATFTGDIPLDGEVGKEGCDLLRAEVSRVAGRSGPAGAALVVEGAEALDPDAVGLLGTVAVVTETAGEADEVEESRAASRRRASAFSTRRTAGATFASVHRCALSPSRLSGNLFARTPATSPYLGVVFFDWPQSSPNRPLSRWFDSPGACRHRGSLFS